MKDRKLLVSFGVITDVQYANRDDAQSWCDPTKWRYYRNSVNMLAEAFRTWRGSDPPVKFVMQLGDLLDGSNRTMDLNPDAAVQKLLSVFDQFLDIPTYHVLGNHELYNFSRKQLSQYLGHAMGQKLCDPLLPHRNCIAQSQNWEGCENCDINRGNLCEIDNANVSINSEDFSSNKEPDEGVPRAYYSFHPCSGVMVVVLDCFDISLPGYSVTHPKYKQALGLLKLFHVSDNQADWEDDAHLEGNSKRFLSYNGAVSQAQLDWLDSVLHAADKAGDKVIVNGHVPLLAESSAPTCVVWNYQEVLEILHRYSCVSAYLAGHLHDEGYALDSHGIHHLTFAGMIEAPPDSPTFSTVHVYSDRLEIAGYGRERSYVLPYPTSHPRTDDIQLIQEHVSELKMPS